MTSLPPTSHINNMNNSKDSQPIRPQPHVRISEPNFGTTDKSASPAKKAARKILRFATQAGGLCLHLLCACCVLSGPAKPARRQSASGARPARSAGAAAGRQRIPSTSSSATSGGPRRGSGMRETRKMSTGSGVHPSAYGRGAGNTFVDWEGSYKRKDSEAAAASGGLRQSGNINRRGTGN